MQGGKFIKDVNEKYQVQEGDRIAVPIYRGENVVFPVYLGKDAVENHEDGYWMVFVESEEWIALGLTYGTDADNLETKFFPIKKAD